VLNTRTGQRLRLANSQRLFGRERETVDEAYAGDVVGVVGNFGLSIGDTLSEKPNIRFDEIPRFAPECFSWLHVSAASQAKRFREGLEQLMQEGVVQHFTQPHALQRVPLLGAVGPLQFEVVQHRLLSEYGAESRLETAPWQHVRWLSRRDGEPLTEAGIQRTSETTLARDGDDNITLLLPSTWALRFFSERNPDLEISEIPPAR
jgi:peptide chain release factor 3